MIYDGFMHVLDTVYRGWKEINYLFCGQCDFRYWRVLIVISDMLAGLAELFAFKVSCFLTRNVLIKMHSKSIVAKINMSLGMEKCVSFRICTIYIEIVILSLSCLNISHLSVREFRENVWSSGVIFMNCKNHYHILRVLPNIRIHWNWIIVVL